MFKLKHTKRHKRQRFALGACDHMIENKSCGWVNCFAVSVKCRWSGGASDLVAMPAVKNEGCPCALTNSDEMDGYTAIALLSITPSIPSECWFAHWNEMQNMMEHPYHISRLQESNIVMMGNWETYCESIQQDMLFSPKDFSVWSAESPCCTREVKKTSLKKSRKAEPTKAHVTPVRLVQDLERGSSIQRLITVITWQASKVRMCLRFLVWLWLILEKVDMKRQCNFGTSHNTYFTIFLDFEASRARRCACPRWQRFGGLLELSWDAEENLFLFAWRYRILLERRVWNPFGPEMSVMLAKVSGKRNIEEHEEPGESFNLPTSYGHTITSCHTSIQSNHFCSLKLLIPLGYIYIPWIVWTLGQRRQRQWPLTRPAEAAATFGTLLGRRCKNDFPRLICIEAVRISSESLN